MGCTSSVSQIALVGKVVVQVAKIEAVLLMLRLAASNRGLLFLEHVKKPFKDRFLDLHQGIELTRVKPHPSAG